MVRLSRSYRETIKRHLQEKKAYPLYCDGYSKAFIDGIICHGRYSGELVAYDEIIMRRLACHFLSRFVEKEKKERRPLKFDHVPGMSFNELMKELVYLPRIVNEVKKEEERVKEEEMLKSFFYTNRGVKK